ncbi:MAG: gfo/Idh/MocA family oxidoreductase, partial [Rhodobacteraceae bacterium]|nr:gfo/Idh/MocA family oxidoreductase [Paracoccaceae bacterium]
MPVQTLDIAEPFFTIRLITDDQSYPIEGKVILLNLTIPAAHANVSIAALESGKHVYS